MVLRHRTLAVAALLGSVLLASGLFADSRRTRPIRKLTYDPTAEKVELFEGIEDGALSTRVVMKDSLQGNVFVENLTDKPLSVEVPESVVAVHVLKQFDDAGGGFGGGFGGDTGGGGGAQGGGQAAGGGLGGGGFGGGMGGMGGGMGGGGFFSIPPKKSVLVPLTSVCLEHGKTEPSPRMDYQLVKMEQFSEDPALHELLKLVGSRRIHPQVAQAAAWNIANDMSWQQLAAKTYNRLGGLPDSPYFTRAQLLAAQSLASTARGIASEKAKADGEKADAPPRTRTRTLSRIR